MPGGVSILKKALKFDLGSFPRVCELNGTKLKIAATSSRSYKLEFHSDMITRRENNQEIINTPDFF